MRPAHRQPTAPPRRRPLAAGRDATVRRGLFRQRRDPVVAGPHATVCRRRVGQPCAHSVAGRATLRRGELGQATVELLAVLPLVLVAAFGGGAILAAHAASQRAGEAARAGAMALLQDADPVEAAREVLGTDDRDAISTRGRRVTVELAPRLPLGLRLPQLTARATADAGPEPRP